MASGRNTKTRHKAETHDASAINFVTSCEYLAVVLNLYEVVMTIRTRTPAHACYAHDNEQERERTRHDPTYIQTHTRKGRRQLAGLARGHLPHSPLENICLYWVLVDFFSTAGQGLGAGRGQERRGGLAVCWV